MIARQHRMKEGEWPWRRQALSIGGAASGIKA